MTYYNQGIMRPALAGRIIYVEFLIGSNGPKYVLLVVLLFEM